MFCNSSSVVETRLK